MLKRFLITQYVMVFFIVIMGLNQSIMTLFDSTPYDMDDLMTVGAGLFILVIGLVNLVSINNDKASLYILSLIVNLIGAFYIILIIITINGPLLFALIPFLVLIGFNIRSIQKLPKEAVSP